jgi:hypothetical protein
MLIRSFIAIWFLLYVGSAGAESREPKPEDPSEKVAQMERALNGSCSYPILEKNKTNKELMCALDALRARCNKIDDCYVYCAGNDVGAQIGGGCTHLCNYSLREKWQPPEGYAACWAK